jgi:galactokinase
MDLFASVEKKFKSRYNEQPLIVRSPGRVNLIGEHTDYNMGFVLPAAIDKAIYFAVAPRTDTTCRIFSVDMNDEHSFDVNDLRATPKGWPNYLMGVVDQFLKAGYSLFGFNCVFGGNIPIGAGLSSSAAIEAGLAYALNIIFELNIDRLTLVRMAQKAENEFVGVQCGIMDQYINIFGQEEKALQLDCRSLQHSYYPFDERIAVVLFDTRVSHSLASSEYNKRRKECAEGVEIIKRSYPAVAYLRDVSTEMLAACKPQMSPLIYRRCNYVVEENNRVLNACRALEAKEIGVFGGYMSESHNGLSREYEVSCRELDFLVEAVRGTPSVYGARMMGGGFGGCTINLVEKDSVAEVKGIVTEKYGGQFGVELKTYVTSISAGTSVVSEKEDAKIS